MDTFCQLPVSSAFHILLFVAVSSFTNLFCIVLLRASFGLAFILCGGFCMYCQYPWASCCGLICPWNIHDQCLIRVIDTLLGLQGGPKSKPYTFACKFANANRFSKFTIRLVGKFAIKLLLSIPPHLTNVTTLPCEILMLKATHNMKIIVIDHKVVLLHI